MSRVQKSVKKSVKTAHKGACTGSWKPRPNTKGRKVTYNGVKYPCPDCGKLIGCDSAGNFNKHGWTVGSATIGSVKKAKAVFSVCAECGDMIDGIDYLCGPCRDS